MATVTVTGLEQLGRALKAFPEVIAKKYLRRATYTAAAVIEADAISRAPVNTGALRDHIAIFKRASDDNSAHYAIGIRGIRLNRKMKKVLRIIRRQNGGGRTQVEGDVFYWRFVEFGTSKMSARPFLRPAFESQKMNAIEVFKTTLADGVAAAAAEAASS
jgi:HK97 gp10 family phage protein